MAAEVLLSNVQLMYRSTSNLQELRRYFGTSDVGDFKDD
jgi:hypothetical protein